MSVTAVQDFYRTAYIECRLDEGHVQIARSIQELVQAWKAMRRWRCDVGWCLCLQQSIAINAAPKKTP